MAPSSSFASPVAGIGESLAGKEQLVSRAASSGHSRGDSGVSWHGEAHPDAAALWARLPGPCLPPTCPHLWTSPAEKSRGAEGGRSPSASSLMPWSSLSSREKHPSPLGAFSQEQKSPIGLTGGSWGNRDPPDPLHAGCDPGISCQSRSRSWSRPHPHL